MRAKQKREKRNAMVGLTGRQLRAHVHSTRSVCQCRTFSHHPLCLCVFRFLAAPAFYVLAVAATLLRYDGR